MNSDIVLAAQGNHLKLQWGFEQTQRFIHSSEARFTRFSESSELSAVNRSSGRWFPVSSELYGLLVEAYAYHEETNGLYDPSILPALERAGYDRSMDEIRAHGAGAAFFANDERGDYRLTEFDPSKSAVRLPHGLRLDLGGIAKGWIAERAAQVLSEYSSACVVNAGGDMFAVGLPEGETAWSIALEDPRDEHQSLAELRVAPGAVATSSITKRRWQQGTRQMHHLIDPRTGSPAETDWLSVTVIAPHATIAEAYAKSLLIGGSGKAEELGAVRDDIAFIAVDAEGKLWGSKSSREFLDVGLEYA